MVGKDTVLACVVGFECRCCGRVGNLDSFIGACISIANVRASATVNNVNENFILSLTESAAKTLDKIPAEVDFSTQCAAVMQDMRMEGVSSAYGYLVDSDGTMLYHPTADKIGKSVENEVVKGVVSQLQSGNIPQDAVVTYNFNGTVKYAAYALTSDHKIVVMSADKGEIMERSVLGITH